MKEPMLTAFELICPVCGSDLVQVEQGGHFCNTLLLICACGAVSNFEGPSVIQVKGNQT